jgi:hypothetical protein
MRSPKKRTVKQVINSIRTQERHATCSVLRSTLPISAYAHSYLWIFPMNLGRPRRSHFVPFELKTNILLTFPSLVQNRFSIETIISANLCPRCKLFRSLRCDS